MLFTVHNRLFFFPNSVSKTGIVSIMKCRKRMVPPPLGTSKRARFNPRTPKDGLSREYILLTLKFNNRGILSAQRLYLSIMVTILHLVIEKEPVSETVQLGKHTR
jgi:hypothetical protein